MFTITKLGDTKNIQLQRRLVNVEFTDGTVTFTKEFSFSHTATSKEVRKGIKVYLDEINEVPEPIADGAIDFSDLTDVPVVETTTEIADRTAQEVFGALWQKLQAHNKLKANGVTWLDVAQEADLISKVTNKMKGSYQSII